MQPSIYPSTAYPTSFHTPRAVLKDFIVYELLTECSLALWEAFDSAGIWGFGPHTI